MRPSVALEMKRGAVREVGGRFRSANPRVFGSLPSAEGDDEGALSPPAPASAHP